MMPSANLNWLPLTNERLSQILLGLVLLCLVWVLQEALTIALSALAVVFVLSKLAIIMLVKKPINLNNNWLKNLGALLVIGILLPQGITIGLLNSMVNLLLAGVCLWWFTLGPTVESNSKITERVDFEQKIQKQSLAMLFLIAVAFIYEQSLFLASLYFLLAIITLFTLLLALTPQLSVTSALNFMAKQLLFIIPLSVFLFVLIPNLPPFWKLPEQKAAHTGLSDNMTAGDIAKLAQSNRLAFRATFVNQAIPSPAQLYWRTLTLEMFNGKTWSLHPQRRQKDNYFASPYDTKQQPTAYSIIAEPTHQRWLYAMTGGLSQQPEVLNGLDNRLIYRDNIKQRIKYNVVTNTNDGKLTTIASDILLRNRQLPNRGLERSKVLSERLWQQAHTDATSKQQVIKNYSNLILDFFANNDFSYSLTPGRLQGDHTDDFLFNKKVGFCAHFASAYTVLMRLQNIPARVVTGYQGGEFNPNGNYFNIDDSMAHAWVEYWLESSENAVGQNLGGWQTADPTAVISPDRINLGQASLTQFTENYANTPIRLIKNIPWLNAIRQQIQSLDYYWTVWVLDFDREQQQDLYSRLFNGQINWTKLATVVGIVLVLPVLLLLLLERKRHVKQSSWQQQTLKRLVKKLKTGKTSVPLYTGKQTLREYQHTLITAFPDKQKQLELLFQLIEFATYKQNSSTIQKKIKQQIKQL